MKYFKPFHWAVHVQITNFSKFPKALKTILKSTNSQTKMAQARCSYCNSNGHSVIDCQAVNQILINGENGFMDAHDLLTIAKDAIKLAKDQRDELIRTKHERNHAKSQANYHRNQTYRIEQDRNRQKRLYEMANTANLKLLDDIEHAKQEDTRHINLWMNEIHENVILKRELEKAKSESQTNWHMFTEQAKTVNTLIDKIKALEVRHEQDQTEGEGW